MQKGMHTAHAANWYTLDMHSNPADAWINRRIDYTSNKLLLNQINVQVVDVAIHVEQSVANWYEPLAIKAKDPSSAQATMLNIDFEIGDPIGKTLPSELPTKPFRMIGFSCIGLYMNQSA